MAGKIVIILCAFLYLVKSKHIQTDNASPKADVMVNPSQGHYEIDYHNDYTYNPSGSIYVTTPKDWTPWINVDSPMFGDGDHELYSRTNPCGRKIPIEIQCRDRGSLKPWYVTRDWLRRRCVLGVGIECLNSDQGVGKRCSDYEVRYKCAYVPGPYPWTEQRNSPIYWGPEPQGVKIDPSDNIEAIDTIPPAAQATKGI